MRSRHGTCRRAVLALALSALGSVACIEDRVTVDINTEVHSDGSCNRHVVYKLERTSPDTDPVADLRPDQDPLRLFHRYPTGEAWTVQHEIKAHSHTVTLDAQLPSPNDIDWDYWRAAQVKAAPARNYFSFAMDGDAPDTRYEYAETFMDPASPFQSVRLLAQLLSQKEDMLARQVAKQLDGVALREKDVARAFHETVTVPFVTEIGRLVSRPVFGPRERADLAKVLERFDPLSEAFAERLAALAPGLAPERVKKALDGADEGFGDSLQAALDAAGLPSPLFGSDNPASGIHFRVTLVMPVPIIRANTCVQGDTATWEFDGDDLYGRGFEMWAIAKAP